MKLFLFILVLTAVLVGCGQQSQELPTLAATAIQAVDSTPTALPPTEIPQGRPTLPPTWTPSIEASQPEVTSTDPPSPVLQVAATLPACATFDVDREKSTSTIIAGEEPLAVWTPVQGALRYRIRLINEFGDVLLLTNDFGEKLQSLIVLESTYSFDVDLFEPGKRYGWGVYPEDSLGQQMCDEIGAELYPALQ